MKHEHLVYISTREAWRAWLVANHAGVTEVWLAYAKKHTGKPRVAYQDAVDEALCFGWIDSTTHRVDDEYYAQRFTPRRPRSEWSETNRKRFRALVREGRMTVAGHAKKPAPRTPAQRAALKSKRAAPARGTCVYQGGIREAPARPGPLRAPAAVTATAPRGLDRLGEEGRDQAAPPRGGGFATQEEPEDRLDVASAHRAEGTFGPLILYLANGGRRRRRPMRRYTAIAALIGAACTTSPTAVRLDQDFELKVGETVSLPGNSARLTFQTVTGDSRCPVDVVCVWAGSAPVVLRLQRATTDTVATVDAVQGKHELVAGGYRIEVRELKPEARAGQPIPAGGYTVVLRASALPL